MTDTSYARISAMLRGRREVRVVQFPGIDADSFEAPVGLRILTEEDADDARSDAQEYVTLRAKKLGISAEAFLRVDPEFLDREIGRQVVFRVCVKPQPEENGEHAPFFPGPTAVRQLDSVMMKTFIEMYDDLQSFVNPLRTATDEELRELVDAVGKGPEGEALLMQFDAPTLRSLSITLALELRAILPSGKSDIGGSASHS